MTEKQEPAAIPSREESADVPQAYTETKLIPIRAGEVEALEEMVRARDRQDNVDRSNTAVLRSLADRFSSGITEEEMAITEVRVPIDSTDPRHKAADGLYSKLRAAFSKDTP